MDLFSYRASVRKSDPITSKTAAASMQGKTSKQHQDILAVMRERGRPLAAEEIGDILEYPIWRRMKELQDAGLIVRTDEKHTNRSGRQGFRYRLA